MLFSPINPHGYIDGKHIMTKMSHRNSFFTPPSPLIFTFETTVQKKWPFWDQHKHEILVSYVTISQNTIVGHGPQPLLDSGINVFSQ